jgi:hypothetical protein
MRFYLRRMRNRIAALREPLVRGQYGLAYRLGEERGASVSAHHAPRYEASVRWIVMLSLLALLASVIAFDMPGLIGAFLFPAAAFLALNAASKRLIWMFLYVGFALCGLALFLISRETELVVWAMLCAGSSFGIFWVLTWYKSGWIV